MSRLHPTIRRMGVALAVAGTCGISGPALSFDLEDYGATYRQTRDAYLVQLVRHANARSFFLAAVRLVEEGGVTELIPDLDIVLMDGAAPDWCARYTGDGAAADALTFSEQQGPGALFAGTLHRTRSRRGAGHYGGAASGAATVEAATRGLLAAHPFEAIANRQGQPAVAGEIRAAISDALAAFQQTGIPPGITVKDRLWTEQEAYEELLADIPAEWGWPLTVAPDRCVAEWWEAWRPNPASSAEIGDVLTTYRARRSDYEKARRELQLATPPFVAARAAYVEAVRVFFDNQSCANFTLPDAPIPPQYFEGP